MTPDDIDTVLLLMLADDLREQLRTAPTLPPAGVAQSNCSSAEGKNQS